MLNKLTTGLNKKLFLSAKKNLFALPKYNFSYSITAEIFPDDIVNNVKKLAEEHSTCEDSWNNAYYDIMDKIHFIDADQYTDIVYLLSKNSKGSDNLWELLGRKVFDYEINDLQARVLVDSFKTVHRIHEFSYTPLIRNLIKQRTGCSDKKALYEKVFM